jgi:hypothetical protein
MDKAVIASAAKQSQPPAVIASAAKQSLSNNALNLKIA